jgi:hypothetical protein
MAVWIGKQLRESGQVLGSLPRTAHVEPAIAEPDAERRELRGDLEVGRRLGEGGNGEWRLPVRHAVRRGQLEHRADHCSFRRRTGFPFCE